MLIQLQNKLALISNPRIIELFLNNVFISNIRSAITNSYVMSFIKGDDIIQAKLYLTDYIGDNAFSNTQIEHVNATHVIKIGNSSFSNCTKLNDITFDDVLYVGQNSFANCQQLTSFDVSHLSDATLHDYAFTDCINLAQLDGLYSLSVIGNGSLKNCNSLNVRFMDFSNPNKTIEFGENALYGVNWLDTNINFETLQLTAVINNVAGLFAGNNVLETVNITSKLNGKTTDMFSGCSKLTSFSSGDLTALNSGTCVNCKELVSIDCPNVKQILDYVSYDQDNEQVITPAFYNNPNLTSINIPNLENCAYFDNTQLTSVNLPNITKLEPGKISSETSVYGFANCSKLQTFSYDNFANLQSIGSKAFANCTSLTSINISDKVSYIADDAFQNDAKTLNSININPNNTHYSNQLSGVKTAATKTEADRMTFGKNFIYDKENKKLVLGCNSTEINPVYSTSKAQWNELVSIIGKYAFRGCSNLGQNNKWNLDAIQSIDDYSFAENENFKTSFIFNAKSYSQLTSIGNCAFKNTHGEAKDFTTTTLGYIGSEAFNGSNIVKSFTFPTAAKINGIGPSAFYGCDGLTSITNLGNNKSTTRILSVGDYAFYNTGITSLKYYLGAGTELPDTFNSHIMGDYAFANCNSLDNVEIGYGTCLGKHTFDGCKNLTTIKFDAGYDSFCGDYVFANCQKLNNITIQAAGKNVGNIGLGENMFYRCTGLTKLVLPKNASLEFQASALNGCTNLNLVTFNVGSCNRIGRMAFNECTSLTSISLNSEITSFSQIDISALYGSSLKQITLPGMDANVLTASSIADPIIINDIPILEQTDNFKYGTWYGWRYDSVVKAYEYATSKQIPVVVLLISPNGDRSRHCNTFWSDQWRSSLLQDEITKTNAIFIVANAEDESGKYILQMFSSQNRGTYPCMYFQKTTKDDKSVITNIGNRGTYGNYQTPQKLIEKIQAIVEGYSSSQEYYRTDVASYQTVSMHNGWGIQHDCKFIAKDKKTYNWSYSDQEFKD